MGGSRVRPAAPRHLGIAPGHDRVENRVDKPDRLTTWSATSGKAATIESNRDQRGSAMSERPDKVAWRIRSSVGNPLTNVVKGLALLPIGLSDDSHVFRDDVTDGHVRV